MLQLNRFLIKSAIIDWGHPRIVQLAQSLKGDTQVETAKNCFEWVRDRIEHCLDFGREEVTCIASDVLSVGTSFCYGKSHLLVSLLRANGIAAGLCYQRLTKTGAYPPFCLHGLVALWLDEYGWMRCDPRGNSKPGVAVEFVPGQDSLAFTHDFPGEMLYDAIWAEPWPELVEALAALKVASRWRISPFDMAPPHGWPAISLRAEMACIS